MTTNATHGTTAPVVCRILLQLAKEQDDLAAAQAAAAHYWEPCPSSVVALRTAAAVLREEAERLAVAS
jgi:hypothetical protein